MGDCLFRRRQLAQLGSATGVYKTLVKYLVGVPQVDILDLFFFGGLICFLASLDLFVHLSNPRKVVALSKVRMLGLFTRS